MITYTQLLVTVVKGTGVGLGEVGGVASHPPYMVTCQ